MKRLLAVVTSRLSLIQSHFAVGQASEQEGLGVREAEHRAAVRGGEAQQTLDGRVDAAVHQDAAQTSKNPSGWSVGLVEAQTEESLTCRPAAPHT